MITDKVCAALAAYIDDRAGTALTAATTTARGSEADLVYPSVVVAENGDPEQHEVLRLEWTVPVRVLLRTIPEDTTEAAHQVLTSDLANMLGDVDAMIGFAAPWILIRDAWGGEGATEDDGSYRQTEFSLELRVKA